MRSVADYASVKRKVLLPGDERTHVRNVAPWLAIVLEAVALSVEAHSSYAALRLLHHHERTTGQAAMTPAIAAISAGEKMQ